MPLERPVPKWFIPLDYARISKRRRVLPHWEQDGASYFVTFRLADAVAKDTALRWKEKKADWLSRHPHPWDAATWERYREDVSEKMELLLDAGYGSCLLRDLKAREIVVGALLFFNGERYDLDGLVVMPNHVHVLFAPRKGHLLSKILHSWKSYTAHQLMKCCPSLFDGSFWLDERFDHAVRNQTNFIKHRRYIRENPTKARLPPGTFTVWEAE